MGPAWPPGRRHDVLSSDGWTVRYWGHLREGLCERVTSRLAGFFPNVESGIISMHALLRGPSTPLHKNHYYLVLKATGGGLTSEVTVSTFAGGWQKTGVCAMDSGDRKETPSLPLEAPGSHSPDA